MSEPADGSENSSIPTEKKKCWIPTSLRRPYLFSVAALYLSMCIAIEAIREYSNRHQGLIHLFSYTELGNFSTRLPTYLPTAFAVLAFTLWNICSLDVLRLEPYFQLAKPEGAPGTVLFTNYCYFFGILAPITAIRNKHWIVVLVSFTAMIQRMVLPSLMSGLVSLHEVNMTSLESVYTWPSLANLENQNDWLEEGRHHRGNKTEFHADTFFFYRTLNYATPPISRPMHWEHGATWQLNQPAYWANLTCTEVRLENLVPYTWTTSNSTSATSNDSSATLTWNIRNVQLQKASGARDDSECEVDILLNSSSPDRKGSYQLRHWEPLDPYNTVNSTSTLTRTGCESLALVGLTININSTSSGNFSSNATVFGCRSTYMHAMAEISLPANTSVATVTNISKKTTNMTSSEISITGLERSLLRRYQNGELPLWGPGYRYSHPGLTRSTGVNSSLIDPLKPSNVGDYQEEIRHLWNRHFTVSMNKFFNTTTPPVRINARQSTLRIVYSVSSHSAIVAESILLASCVLLFSMFFLYQRRPNFLQSDPGSIAVQCAIITDIFTSTDAVIKSDIDFHTATPRQLRQFARSLWCRWIDGPDRRQMEIIPREVYVASSSSRTSRLQKLARARRSRQATRRPRSNAKPHFVKTPWFLLECIAIAGVLAGFGASFQFLHLDKLGYSLTTGATILYLYLIYGPTVIASIISSLFISVHRHLSNLEPWVQLKEGAASARESLSVNYGSKTPITIWKQFRSNAPPILVMLSSVCLIDYFLTVVSSGMFEPTVDHWSEVTADLVPQYHDSHFLNPEVRVDFHGYNLIEDTLSTNHSILAWTTANTSFVPFEVKENDEFADWKLYTARTRGIGVDLQCAEISSSNSHVISDNRSWTYTPSHSSSGMKCTAEFQQTKHYHHAWNESTFLISPTETDIACQKSFVLVSYGGATAIETIVSANPTAFHCQPKIQIQDYDIHFCPEGLIQSYSPVAGSMITQGRMFQNASDSLASFTQAFTRDHDGPALVTSEMYASSKRFLGFKFGPQDQTALLRAVKLVYQSTFSMHTSLWRDLYLDVLPDESRTKPVNGTLTAAVWDVPPSDTTIVIMIIILSFDFAVLIFVFWLRRKYYNGPPIPRSIGSLMPWIANTRMLSDIRGTMAWSETEQRDHLEALGRRYRFGQFDASSGLGGPGKVALDYDDEKVPEAGRGEEYEMDDAPPLGNSGPVFPLEVSLAAVGSESTLVDTHTTANTP
ncbi:hypothetical protein N7508_007183 [Penicillium antarcticum]|uniref:uncharacterized protein n=1 Tax=Penicillium antarcticum TaxID=416450 RepID=UPI00238AEC3F|nr:uncharacterized protein N7508_007183 [Penicillium antarcticum]KAJ5302320.1 hypothetical protein N7508_007183 [Penicillium antarcticum]